MKKLLPALPLFAAFAILFNVPVFADVVFFPHRLVNTLIAVAAVLLLLCISAAIVLAIIFIPKIGKKKDGENK